MSDIGTSGFTQPALGAGPPPPRSGLLAAREYLEIRFGGFGEQGVILMGVILAMAATLDHRYVAQTQTYGLDERGGYGHSDVLVSDRPIDYPELEAADLLVALCQEAADGYVELLRPDGILIYDSGNVTRPPGFEGTNFGIPFGTLVGEAGEQKETAAIALTLAAVVAITGVVSVESLQRAMRDLAPHGGQQVHKDAFAAGLALDPADWRRTRA